MGDMCREWTYKPLLWILVILVSLSFIVHCSEIPKTSGPVYSRGNAWAVGHLMGKKSLDSLSDSEESSNRGSDYGYIPSSEEDKLVDRYVQPSNLGQAFLRALGGLEKQRQTPNLMELQKDRERYYKQLTDFIRLDFNKKNTS